MNQSNKNMSAILFEHSEPMPAVEIMNSQKNGTGNELTRPKALMLLTRHPWYGLIRFTLEPCNLSIGSKQ